MSGTSVFAWDEIAGQGDGAVDRREIAGKAGALKSSGAVAPGLMRSTRPRLFDQ